MSATARHPERAARFLRDADRARHHDGALWQIRKRRDQAAAGVAEWSELREHARGVKAHVLSRLGHYLRQFEDNARRRGIVVHFAHDAAEHNRIVLDLLQRRGVRRVVKSKSMLTEECGLNPWLERHGIEVTDTDLGELIVQLRREPPSHIVLPAIHLRRADVASTFRRELGATLSDEAATPERLTEVARQHLRRRFLAADAGITGVNFAVAETGGFVVCTNEGNADLGTSLPPLHVACMGLEKLIPRASDLGVFLRLLARSATGQAITAYTSHFHGPRPGGELHVIVVDNGRSDVLARPEHRRALSCIRCGACMNTCPVYRRSGGHSYGTHVPGPIGSILAPLRDPVRHDSLPHACTLCGSCTLVCPVGIDLHEQLLTLRQGSAGRTAPGRERAAWAARALAWLLSGRRLFAASGRFARWLLRRFPRLRRVGPLGAWHAGRELPVLPARSFRDEHRRRVRDERRARSRR